jgi:hypothetical protein
VSASVGYTVRPQNNSTQKIYPPTGGKEKLFSELLKNQDNKIYKITLKPKEITNTVEHIKIQVKNSINSMR